ncbi:MAG: class I SAM-dependent methyltransferase [Nitrospirota bacterium]|nr:class I SAM-dependent methyltransferase [Nitrospirota bacterium]
MTDVKEKRHIKDWWADRPMTYGQSHGDPVYQTETGELIAVEMGSRAFFEQVDKTFYSWTEGFHTPQGHFAGLFPYERYRNKRVLEIGCGMGTMVMNWAKQGAHVTAVDLNPVAIAQTKRRFDLLGLKGDIREMDANALQFPDASFDYVYSWGVLHHSPDLPRSITELLRVLKPDGEYGIMLYNRASVYYWYLVGYVAAFLHGESRFLNPLELASRYTDGAEQEGNPYTWPVTKREMKALLAPHSSQLHIYAMGPVDYAFPPKIGGYLPSRLIQAWAKRWAWSLYMRGTKRAAM